MSTAMTGFKSMGSTIASNAKADPFNFASGIVKSGFSLFGGSKYTPSTNPYETNYGAYSSFLELQNQANDEEASLIDRQAQLSLEEALTEALHKKRDGEAFRSQQALDYLGSGVTLEGTPLVVLEDTRKKVDEEANAIYNRGAAEYELGRRKAQLVRTQGRASVLGQQLDYSNKSMAFNNEQQTNRIAANAKSGQTQAAGLDSLFSSLFGS